MEHGEIRRAADGRQQADIYFAAKEELLPAASCQLILKLDDFADVGWPDT
jgi:hypothetical protein